MTTTNWKRLLGEQLRTFRLKAHGGKGITLDKAAATIGRTRTYINRLETQMEKQNPSMKILEQLCTLYGRPIGDLFEPIVPSKAAEWQSNDLHVKLDEILRGPEKIASAIEENILGMHDRMKRHKK